MKKIYEILLKNKKYSVLGLIVVVFMLIVFIGGKHGEVESFEVTRGDVENSIILSGKVMTTNQADLGFASSGRVSKIFVKNNEIVNEGSILAQLEIGDLLADLKIKELNYQSSNLDLEDAKQNLEKVTAQENAKLESAYRALLSDGLEVIPNSYSYDVDAPTVSGFYSGAEGQYKIKIDRDEASPSKYRILTFKIEETNTLIKDEGPTPLGKKGLYISFPVEDLADYVGTIWYIDIPNKSSSSYVSNLNSYNEAVRARDLAIKDAEFDYKKILNEEGGTSSVGQAEVDKIRSEIRKNTIYAPFTGKVTNIEKEVGENASLGERIISILGEDTLEVELQVPELDVSKISPDGEVRITVDALPGEEFTGVLKTINSRETEIDGVPVYEAFVTLNPDPRIKTGMSANGIIVLDFKKDVVIIPSYMVQKVGDKNYVQVVKEDGSKEEREVTLGLVGTDKMVEVVAGLNAGEKIVPVNE
ncbi:MAG: efflux RND transporter periplasmic adaptor subunit [Candidatus Pacebacteria bacterium]|nr:efflux RND transporter periplasmic adaptor subunit [Candidatus Paceibacterota bacterium]